MHIHRTARSYANWMLKNNLNRMFRLFWVEQKYAQNEPREQTIHSTAQHTYFVQQTAGSDDFSCTSLAAWPMRCDSFPVQPNCAFSIPRCECRLRRMHVVCVCVCAYGCMCKLQYFSYLICGLDSMNESYPASCALLAHDCYYISNGCVAAHSMRNVFVFICS